ncbi:hypothetical protein QR680_000591 [Steinernema hermaphroditum]|uniref:RRM domain-containing protein n=1 Tax=Steinernema hermaphroditum TaxID=289476 RepID=A0AA39GV59_9BILA|nr:hypothetical protein QR680_000591 [Steinernema hermaphroditum]
MFQLSSYPLRPHAGSRPNNGAPRGAAENRQSREQPALNEESRWPPITYTDSDDIDQEPSVFDVICGGGTVNFVCHGPLPRTPLSVQRTVRRGQHKESLTPRHERKIFVGNISPSTTENDLHRHFSRYGTVQNVTLPRDRDAREHRGYGYVLFTEKDCMQNVLNPDHWHIINDQEVDVQPLIGNEFHDERQRKAAENAEMVKMFQAMKATDEEESFQRMAPWPKPKTSFRSRRMAQIEPDIDHPAGEDENEVLAAFVEFQRNYE